MGMLKRAIFPLFEGWLRWVGGPVGVRLRRSWYKRRLKSCGKRVTIDLGVVIEGPEFVSIGDDVWIDKFAILVAGPNEKSPTDQPIDIPFGEVLIGKSTHIGPNTIIQSHGGVRIGDYCTIGFGGAIYSQSNHVSECRFGTTPHDNYNPPKMNTPVRLGSNVWCGLSVKVFGANIGDDVFVKANTIVTENIPSNRIIGCSNGVYSERARFSADGKTAS